MTRHQLNHAIARATGDRHSIISSRGFSLVDESAAMDDCDFEDLIADWDRIRNEAANARVGWTITSTPNAARARKSKRVAASVVG